jgi:glycosyltransferase involved in cell wall biosynthesis
MTEKRPAVSVLLPTFNRAAFLAAAFDSIRGQAHTDWEVVVIDDGSTDETHQVVDRFIGTVRQHVHYERQENAGAYAARNRGLDLASGRYIAFFDSDDTWLSHHLADCVRALEDNPTVDWVYGASRIVDHVSGQTVDPNNFIADDRPRAFRHLRTTTRGGVRIIDDSSVVECAILRGLFAGLQNSVIRANVFANRRFRTRSEVFSQRTNGLPVLTTAAASARGPGELENVAEDQVYVIRALKEGYRFGYFDDVHVEYHVHSANSSASTTTAQSVERQLLTFGPLVRGFEDLSHDVSLSSRERRALAKRLAREYFWHIGYTVFWANGRREDAIKAFRRGLALWPWSLRCWKTYTLARVRMVFERARL